jgi:hypothetical protein
METVRLNGCDLTVARMFRQLKKANRAGGE